MSLRYQQQILQLIRSGTILLKNLLVFHRMTLNKAITMRIYFLLSDCLLKNTICINHIGNGDFFEIDIPFFLLVLVSR